MGVDAARVVPGPATSRVVLTCEHATNALPPRWAWPTVDAWLVSTHWSWDPGAAAVTHALAADLGAPAVLARFSRLLADPNRPSEHPDLFRTVADGRPVVLNQAITPDERAERLAFHAAYHAAVDARVGATPDAMVWSIHSFTPVYEGVPRAMEVAVIVDHDDALAERAAHRLSADGWVVAVNEPYSGKGGLMYSADRHARAHGRPALELELRQDLLAPGPRREALLASVRAAILHTTP